MPENLYTTGEVAKIFGVSYTTVKEWAYSGKIKYIKTPGGKYSEIKRLLGEAPKGRCRSFRSPRRPSHEKRREGMKVNARPEQPSAISKH
jgi:excisionase family DNA binding protein